MSRQVRRVPAGWEHPLIEGEDEYQPMYDQSWEEAVAEWEEGLAKWNSGLTPYHNGRTLEWRTDDPDGNRQFCAEWADYSPRSEDRGLYRPNWTREERTHFQFYEGVSEGTPISPVFPSLEELAKWLEVNGHTIAGHTVDTREGWMERLKHLLCD